MHLLEKSTVCLGNTVGKTINSFPRKQNLMSFECRVDGEALKDASGPQLIPTTVLCLLCSGERFIKCLVSDFTDNCYKLLKSLHLIG